MNKQSLIYHNDTFLGKILKKKSYQFFKVPNNIYKFNECKFAYIKTNISCAQNEKLIKSDFYLVTLMATLRLENITKTALFEISSNVKLASLKDKNALKLLAYNAFNLDRFHVDFNISKCTASKIKSEWIGNFFNGERGNKCFVYKKNNKCLGFLLTIEKRNNVVIDLIAVGHNSRNKGVAKNLINYMLHFYKNKLNTVEVGTQFNNKASLYLYKSFDFEIRNYTSVWHWHSHTHK